MEPEKCRLAALFIIHSGGVILALASVLHLRLRPFTNLSSGQLRFMMWTVVVVAIVSLHLIMLTPGVGTSLWELLEEPVPNFFSSFITLQLAIFICAVIDISGLGILIGITGGPLRSMYFPMLLIILPLIIMLDANCTTVWICFVLTIMIFLLCLHLIRNRTLQLTRELIYNLHFTAITSLCVFFPILLRLIAYKHT